MAGVYLVQSPRQESLTRWWQRLVAQVIFSISKSEIVFVNPMGENFGARAIGSILVAMSARAVAGLIAASWKVLGVAATPFADEGQDQSPTTIAEAPE